MRTLTLLLIEAASTQNSQPRSYRCSSPAPPVSWRTNKWRSSASAAWYGLPLEQPIRARSTTRTCPRPEAGTYSSSPTNRRSMPLRSLRHTTSAKVGWFPLMTPRTSTSMQIQTLRHLSLKSVRRLRTARREGKSDDDTYPPFHREDPSDSLRSLFTIHSNPRQRPASGGPDLYQSWYVGDLSHLASRRCRLCQFHQCRLL